MTLFWPLHPCRISQCSKREVSCTDHWQMWSQVVPVTAEAGVKDWFTSQPIDCGVCSSILRTGVKTMDGFVIKLPWFLKAVRFQSGHIHFLCDVPHPCNHCYPQQNCWACFSNEDVIFFPSVSLAFSSVSPKGSLSSLPRFWAIARLSSEDLCYFNVVLVKYLSHNWRRRETSSKWY